MQPATSAEGHVRHELDWLKNIVIDLIGQNTLDAIFSDNQAQQSMRLISTIKGFLTVMCNLYCVSLVAACRSVNTVLQKQLTEEKDSKEQILRERDQLAQVRSLITFLQPLLLLTSDHDLSLLVRQEIFRDELTKRLSTEAFCFDRVCWQKGDWPGNKGERKCAGVRTLERGKRKLFSSSPVRPHTLLTFNYTSFFPGEFRMNGCPPGLTVIEWLKATRKQVIENFLFVRLLLLQRMLIRCVHLFDLQNLTELQDERKKFSQILSYKVLFLFSLEITVDKTMATSARML